MKQITNSSYDDQEKLNEALANVKAQSLQMQVSLDKGKFMEALKIASNMLSELRTSLLSPKSYYELYMNINDQLRHLEVYLSDEFNKGKKMADLYELVQYAGNIIPRLYLLITVGLVYMKTTPGCRRDILKDLVEMCRGVQHPLRGLFLRNYLLQSCRNVLPDVTVENFTGAGDGKEDHSGTVTDSVEFILQNFAEMNKLWVRMQHQGHSRDKERREKERLDLRLLVGTNMVRLSQLESIDLNKYKTIVLPGILEQVVSCRDGIAQEYLMECLIQVFPDEYHLSTLTPFLNSCAQLVETVNVKNIIITLIDRLTASKDIELPNDLFDIFSEQIMNIKMSRPAMPLEDIISMEGSLVYFSMKKIDNAEKREKSIDSVLKATLNVILEKQKGVKISYNSNIGKDLLKLLSLPITPINGITVSSMEAIKMSLKLVNFRELLKQVCDYEIHKRIALLLLNSALDSETDETIVDEYRLTIEEIEIFLNEICEPLRVDNQAKKEQNNNSGDLNTNELDEDFVDEQNLVARFIHYMLSPICIAQDNLDTHYLVLSTAKKSLEVGKSKRIKYTFPSLVYEALNLTLKYSEKGPESDDKYEKKCGKIFKFVHQTIKTLMEESNSAYLCLKLILESALNANKTKIENHETIAYDFISQAFALYEEEIVESRQQLSCLLLIIGSLKEIDFQSEEHYSPLRSQCYLNCMKLVKKSDQVRAILNASVLFVNNNIVEKDGIKCIEKSIKGVSTTLDQELQLQLYVDILSNLTLFADCENKNEIEKIVFSLITKIEDLRTDVPFTELIERQYYNNLEIWKKSKSIEDLIAKISIKE